MLMLTVLFNVMSHDVRLNNLLSDSFVTRERTCWTRSCQMWMQPFKSVYPVSHNIRGDWKRGSPGIEKGTLSQ